MNYIHPWRIVKKVIEKSGFLQKDTAIKLWISEKHLSQIINGHKRITIKTALKLVNVFEWQASFWLNLQQKYDLNITK